MIVFRLSPPPHGVFHDILSVVACFIENIHYILQSGQRVHAAHLFFLSVRMRENQRPDARFVNRFPVGGESCFQHSAPHT